MSDINTATLTGRLAQDPAVFDTENGKIVRFTLASNADYKVGDEFKSRVTYNSVAVFDKFKADTAAKLHKGDTVLIQGAVETHSYESEGQTKYTTEIALRPMHSLLKKLNVAAKEKAGPQQTASQAAGSRPARSAQRQPA